MDQLVGKHVKSVLQWDRATIEALLASAAEMQAADARRDVPQLFIGRVMTALFFENSSRTYCSFVAAFQKLGGSVVTLPIERSSVAKGESLSDTIRTVDSYSDVLVLRHPEKEALEVAASVARAPIINAGNGTGEHPTQALLDMFSIHQELGRLDNIAVALVGDLKNGRTVHSLAKALVNFRNVSFHFVAPTALQMPADIVEFLRAKGGVSVTLHELLTPDVMASVDVAYVTRVQKERFASLDEYEAVKNSYCVNAEALRNAKPAGQMIVLHPLPRNEELSTDIDADPRAAYFRQMRYGLYARMALLAAVVPRSAAAGLTPTK